MVRPDPLKQDHRRTASIALTAILASAGVLGVLLQTGVVFAAPETWYALSSAGQACGTGDRESISVTPGSSLATKLLDGTGDTWNRSETTRSIVAGDW